MQPSAFTLELIYLHFHICSASVYTELRDVLRETDQAKKMELFKKVNFILQKS